MMCTSAIDVNSDIARDRAARLVDTVESNPDSDGGGIGDKVEVYSYVFGRIVVPRHPYRDNDSLRPEMDVDSDDDACTDGEEDTNKNGVFYRFASHDGTGYAVEQTETDPYTSPDFTLLLNVPESRLLEGESTEITATLLDVEGRPQANRVLQLSLDPP